jgi:hypothetical protein
MKNVKAELGRPPEDFDYGQLARMLEIRLYRGGFAVFCKHSEFLVGSNLMIGTKLLVGPNPVSVRAAQIILKVLVRILSERWDGNRKAFDVCDERLQRWLLNRPVEVEFDFPEMST